MHVAAGVRSISARQRLAERICLQQKRYSSSLHHKVLQCVLQLLAICCEGQMLPAASCIDLAMRCISTGSSRGSCKQAAGACFMKSPEKSSRPTAHSCTSSGEPPRANIAVSKACLAKYWASVVCRSSSQSGSLPQPAGTQAVALPECQYVGFALKGTSNDA